MDWNKAAEGFKFNIGDSVKVRVGHSMGIVVSLCLENDGGSEPHRQYFVSFERLFDRPSMCHKINEFEIEKLEKIGE